MEQFLHFIATHWVLSGLFVVLFVLVILEESRRQGGGGTALSPTQLIALMNQDKILVVDIRDANTFKDGHIIGAVNIPAAALSADHKKISKHKDSAIALVCAAGHTAVGAMGKLKKAGCQDVRILKGGMGAWRAANMPTVKK